MTYLELRNLMDTTDKTLLRCIENGVSIPPAWVTYRIALRALIAAGVAATPPTQPSFPAGT